MPTIGQMVIDAIRAAAVYNPDVQVAPACILWPDRDRQWEPVIPRLQAELPELFVLGDYDPEQRRGPAIWLRCVLAGCIMPKENVSTENIQDKQIPYCTAINIPVFYLPGVSRQDLRAVESCPEPLKPLAELQYRGVIWSQINARDWTVLAFLKSDQGGLGLDVAQDNEAKNAMQLAVNRILDEEVDLLQGRHLDKDYFNTLLSGGDPVRELLLWLDQGDAFRKARSDEEWQAFVAVCRSQLAFDPDKEGMLAGARRLALHEGPWQGVWQRFCEAPRRYPNIPARIRQCDMPLDLFANAESHAGWPQWNESRENDLRKDLLALGDLPPHKARNRLVQLEDLHAPRRKLVWAELGAAPLACALAHLKILAEVTAHDLGAGSCKDLAAAYGSSGWRADDAVVRALACVSGMPDLDAVGVAIRCVYAPWADASARYLQKVVSENGYPGGSMAKADSFQIPDGTCTLFTDGLRLDTARRLGECLTAAGCRIEERLDWAPLPSVTATGKPARTPVTEKLGGEETNIDFEPMVIETGKSLKGGDPLRKLIAEAGWEVLKGSETGSAKGRAWCECGDIDHEGHQRGWKLAGQLDTILNEIGDRVRQLLDAGWKAVRIVTDHGWLLLPGGLPKVQLAAVLTESKWGRCAVIKPGAHCDAQLFPWYWNPNQHFALADGIGCYRAGEEYAHGGLSLQECLVLELSVTNDAQIQAPRFSDVDITWKQMRCYVETDGALEGVWLDLRRQAGDAESSVVLKAKPLKDNGTGSVVVKDDTLDGQPVTLVLMDADGTLLAQKETVIGGGDR